MAGSTRPSRFMRLALAQARQARGLSSPNPPVGAVVVRDGRLVGRGHTQPPGHDHAEIVALRQAGPGARGADLYVTLEPCSHHGRTPPCTDAIVAAGVRRVFAATVDPNPRVNGSGLRQLEAAGLAVAVGDGAAEAAALIEGFTTHLCTGRPLVTAKFAVSLDGCIATRGGESQWISGPTARAAANNQRATYDAILVGAGTVRADDPRLTARDAAGRARRRQPLRVVVSTLLDLPLAAKLFDPALPGTTLVVHAVDAPGPSIAALQSRGVGLLSLPAREDGRLDLAVLMDELGCRGVTTLLAEGGAGLLGSLFDQRLVHRVQAYVAPLIIGGRQALRPVAGDGPQRLADALDLGRLTVRRVGHDVVLTGYVQSTTAHLPLTRQTAARGQRLEAD